MNELERIELLASIYAEQNSRVEMAIGDDAAMLGPSGRPLAVSVDVAVEGVHFRRGWLAFEALGRRALMAAASDIAAMGADFVGALSSLVLPPDIDDAALEAIAQGTAYAARSLGGSVVGGNLSEGSELSITTTVFGDVGQQRLRSGAAVGEGIFVTHTLGGAAAGCACLYALRPDAPAVERWRRPTARIELGKTIAEFATAMIDISDGLLQDLGHICRASKVGAQLKATAIPLDEVAIEAGSLLNLDPLHWALSGGEDYELLFTAPQDPGMAEVRRIGTVVEGDAIAVLDEHGSAINVPRTGHRHFE